MKKSIRLLLTLTMLLSFVSATTVSVSAEEAVDQTIALDPNAGRAAARCSRISAGIMRTAISGNMS